jgi:hypothetical protein
MRKYYYSPTAVDRLADLNITELEFNILDERIAAIARDPHLGSAIPFLLIGSDHLFRFEVGRFALIYRYNKDEIEVVTVM